MIISSTFKPAWWLTNTHAQTIYPTLMGRSPVHVDVRERIELPDGDFIDLAWSTKHLDQESPLVIFLHGLGGSIDSGYVSGQFAAFHQQGWRAVLMHFRGASDEPNRLPRAYHAGDTADLDYILHQLHQREPRTKKVIVGVSLGGNVLLKWLGEQREQHLVRAAVAVSVPFQLRLLADKLNHGVARCYQTYLLHRFRRVFAKKEAQLPFTLDDLKKWRCFWTFDNAVTAPLHGFSHVHAYYDDASSKKYLASIETPTLILHAKDDPFMTSDIVPQEHDLSPYVTLELSERGGHVGFIAGSIPGKPVYWLDYRIPVFLRAYL